MEHSELVAEMVSVEHLSTQDRLHLARVRRAQQLKIAKQKEKEWLKSQSRRDRAAALAGKKQRHITFENSVVVLEAAARNDIEEVDRLLQLGVSPDATNEDGLTPLHQCCIDNNADMLRLLLDYGADVNANDSEKWTPLHAAATCGHLFLVKILISRGANLLAVNVDGNMPYDLCDDEETLDCIEAEMSRRGVTQELIDETRAATETQMLRDLMEAAARGGDLEPADKYGATPLHIAAANGYSKVVAFLLEHHANVDAEDRDRWTPVHAAACWGHMEVLEMLAASGADLNACNKNEETPSDICEDAEIRQRIEQLKTEQESKRQAEAQRKRVRRSQSNNTRAQSVRRTSLRDKTLTTKKDAVEETRLRMQAQEGYTVPDSTTEPNSIASDMPDAGASSERHHGHQFLANGSALTNGHHRGAPQQPINGAATSRYGVAATVEQQQQQPRHSATSSTHTIASGASGDHSFAVGGNVAYAPQLFDTASAHSRRSPDGTDNSHNSAYNHHQHHQTMLSAGAGDGTNNGDEQLGNVGLLLPPPHANINSLNNNHNAATSTTTTSSTASSSAPPNFGKMGNQNISTEIFSTSNDNGKINVQVTVLVDTHQLDQSIAGTTLANLKKQRAQSRTTTTTTTTSSTTTDSNGAPGGGGGGINSITSSQPADGASLATSASSYRNSLASNSNASHLMAVGDDATAAIHQRSSIVSHGDGGGDDMAVNGFESASSSAVKLSDEPTLARTASAAAAAPSSSETQSQRAPPKIAKFSGVTSDVVSDSTSRRCCVLM